MYYELMPKKGFTLIELLIVIAIIISLAAVVVIQFTGAQGAARDTRRKSDLRQYQTALEKYANLNNGLYPNYGSGNNLSGLCAVLGIGGQCIDDTIATQPYRYWTTGGSGAAGSATAPTYLLYARLEKPTAGQNQYWILCSNGNVGRIPSNGAGAWTPSGTCPNNLQQ